MVEQRTYAADDWPHGLRCSECDTLFIEGQPISERLDCFIGDMPCVVLVCVGCAMAGTAGGAA